MVEKTEIAKGFSWTSVTQLISVLVKFLSLVILSRILSPKEYGLLGIIMIFIEVGYMICDSGMGGFLVKKRNCKHIDFDTLFVYNIFACALIYGVLWIIAPYIADFYQEDLLTKLIRIASLQIVIQTLYIPQYIHVLKELDFRSIAIATTISAIGGLTVAVIMAYADYGVWALVGQYISEAIFLFLCYSLVARYLPRLQFSTKSFKEQFSFGINLLGANLLNTISNNIYSNVVAKVVDLRSAGYFVQATRIQNLPVYVTNGIIERALFPILSKCNDKEEFEEIYFRVYGVVLMLICFLASFIFFFSSDLVVCFLGTQWKESSHVLSVLSISIVPLVIQTLCRNALKSQGMTYAILKNQTLKTVVLIVTLILASLFGFWYIVYGIVIVQFFVALLIVKVMSKRTMVSMKKHFTIMSPFVVFSIIATAVPFMLFAVDIDAIIRVILCFLISVTLYAAGLYLIKEKIFLSLLSFATTKIRKD